MLGYLLTKENIAKVPRKAGIYWIYVQERFPRLKGETNVVYIGRANNLCRRLKSFLGIGVRRALPRFKRLQKNGFSLFFRYEVGDNYVEMEQNKLWKFEQKHLELPSLNRASDYAKNAEKL